MSLDHKQHEQLGSCMSAEAVYHFWFSALPRCAQYCMSVLCKALVPSAMEWNACMIAASSGAC